MKLVNNKNSVISDISSCPSSGGDFSGSIMHAIHLFYFSIHKHLEQTLAHHNQISFSQFMILVGFSNKECPIMTQAKLAEHLMLTEATISRHITTLVAKELLTKTKDSSNKKSYKLSLTPLGQKEYKAAKKIITKELDSYFSLIKEADTQIIIKNLSRITALITQPKN